VKPVVWSQEAQTAYREIIAYIAADNPLAASRVGARLMKAAAQLGAMPTGRPGRVHGVYEKVVRGLPYTIGYVVTPIWSRSSTSCTRRATGATGTGPTSSP